VGEGEMVGWGRGKDGGSRVGIQWDNYGQGDEAIAGNGRKLVKRRMKTESLLSVKSYLQPGRRRNHCQATDKAKGKSRFLTKESPCTVSAARKKQIMI